MYSSSDESDLEDEEIVKGVFPFAPYCGTLRTGQSKLKFEETELGEVYFTRLDRTLTKVIGQLGYVCGALEYRLSGFRAGNKFIVVNCIPVSCRKYQKYILFYYLDKYISESEKDAIIDNGYDIETMERLYNHYMDDVKNKDGRVYFHFDTYRELFKLTGKHTVFTLTLPYARSALEQIKSCPIKACMGINVSEYTYVCRPEVMCRELGITLSLPQREAIDLHNAAEKNGGKICFGADRNVLNVLKGYGAVVEVGPHSFTTVSYRDEKRYFDWLKKYVPTKKTSPEHNVANIRYDMLLRSQQSVVEAGTASVFQIVGSKKVGKTFIGKLLASLDAAHTVIVSKITTTVDEYLYDNLMAYNLDVAKEIDFACVKTLIIEDAHRFTPQDISDNLQPKNLERVIFIGDDRVSACDNRGETIISRNKIVGIPTKELLEKDLGNDKVLLTRNLYRLVDLSGVKHIKYTRGTVYTSSGVDLTRLVYDVYTRLKETERDRVLWLVEDEYHLSKVSQEVNRFMKRDAHQFYVGQSVRYKMGRDSSNIYTVSKVSNDRKRSINGSLRSPITITRGAVTICDVGDRKRHDVPPSRIMSGVCMKVSDFLKNEQDHDVIILYKCSCVEKLVYRVSLQSKKALLKFY